MLEKTRVHNPDKSRNGGSRAIKLSGVTEWLVFAGHAAIDKDEQIVHPGDALAQHRWIWASLGHVLEQEGWSLTDVIKLQITVTEEVPEEDYVKILGTVGEVFAGIPIPPVGATMKAVNALARPGMLIEVDIMAAR